MASTMNHTCLRSDLKAIWHVCSSEWRSASQQYLLEHHIRTTCQLWLFTALGSMVSTKMTSLTFATIQRVTSMQKSALAAGLWKGWVATTKWCCRACGHQVDCARASCPAASWARQCGRSGSNGGRDGSKTSYKPGIYVLSPLTANVKHWCCLVCTLICSSIPADRIGGSKVSSMLQSLQRII